jgi:hypothetical protein
MEPLRGSDIARQAFPLIELELGGEVAHIINTICTLGTAIDLTLRELRIEMFHAADENSRQIVHAFAQWRQQLSPVASAPASVFSIAERAVRICGPSRRVRCERRPAGNGDRT